MLCTTCSGKQFNLAPKISKTKKSLGVEYSSVLDLKKVVGFFSDVTWRVNIKHGLCLHNCSVDASNILKNAMRNMLTTANSEKLW